VQFPAQFPLPHQVGEEIKFGMPDMRSHALLQCAVSLTPELLLQRMVILPEVAGAQLVPLWNIVGPHAGKPKPGPARGPVFYVGNVLLESRW
jgi:hypothetical protein